MKKLLLVLLCLPFIGFGQKWSQIGSDINGEAASDESGASVSLSADGTTLAIGARFNAGNGSNSGHVRVYKNIAGYWSQIGQDIDGEAADDQSGQSVSLSADGSTVAIGARYNDGNGYNSGHVRVYQNVAGTWTQIGSDINGEAANDYSGACVSLSADGATLAIGARHNDGNGTDAGHVRVYQNIAGSWSQIGQDINGEAVGDYSGESIYLSADGSTLAIGARHNDGNGAQSGHVRVYQNVTGSWVQIGSDINGEAASDYSGVSVSLSADGATLAIGAHYNDGNGSNSGHVRVYQNVAGTWSQIGQDINGEAAGDYSGRCVSLSADGATLAIGANQNDGNGADAGHVRMYLYNGISWSQIGSDNNGEAAGDQSGYSVSLSADGATVAIGANYNDGSGSNSGHVRIFNFKTTKTELKHFVEKKINQWELKGEFETTSDYGLRVNEKTRKDKITEFQEEAINTLKSNFLKSINFSNIELGAYDADKQTFLLKAKDSKVGNLVLFVPINEAPNFKENFSKYKYLNPQSEFIDAKFVLSHVDVVFGKKTYSYDIPNNICTSGDCENGYGVFTSAEGTYKGNWKNGKVHGTGVFVGILYTYDGEYVNGQQHGQGKKTFTSGKIEEGTFENGNFLGK